MNYSDIISRSFRTLGRGSIWAFMVSVLGVVFLGLAVIMGAALVAAGGSDAVGSLVSAIRDNSTPDASVVGLFLAFGGALFLFGIFSIPLELIGYGGLIHQTSEVMAGRSATVGGAWSFGARRMGRVFAIEFVIGALALGLILVGTIPLVAGIVAAVGKNAGAGVAGICGGILLLLVAVIAVIMLGGFEALAIRYALIGDRSAGDALSAGWSAFRARFGSVLAFLLIVFGFSIVVSMVQSFVDFVARFTVLGTSGIMFAPSAEFLSSGEIRSIAAMFAISYVIAFVFGMVLRIFQASMWTAFFRQMTGLDAPLPTAADRYSGYTPTHPASYQPPTAAAPGYPPMAPTLGYPPMAPGPAYPPPAPPAPPPSATPFSTTDGKLDPPHDQPPHA